MTTLQNIKSSLFNNKTQLILLAIYSIVIVFFCSKMSPLYIINDWSDINLYFNISKAMCNGQILYTDVFDHKGPMIFFIYSIGYLISNDSFLGMFIIESIAWVALSYTAYYTTKLFLSKTYSLLSAIFFLPFFLSHTIAGGSAEEFLAVGMAVSLFFFIRYFRNPQKHSYKVMLFHGIAWGVVLLTKFNLTTFWIFPLMAIAIILISKKEYKNLIINILFFILGGAIAIAPILIYFMANKALPDAIEAYITTNSSSLKSFQNIAMYTIMRFYQCLKFETLDFSLILIGAFVFPLVLLKNNIAKLGIMASFCSLFIAICMSQEYIYYYSIPYYIYIFPAFTLIVYGISKLIKKEVHPIIIIVIASILLGNAINAQNFFGYSKEELLRKEDPKDILFQFSKTISKEVNPTLMCLELDRTNGIFTYLNIMPNVRYFISPNLTYERYPKMRDEQTKNIQDRKINFIILREGTKYYDYFNNLEELRKNYYAVDSCAMYSDNSQFAPTYYLYKLKD